MRKAVGTGDGTIDAKLNNTSCGVPQRHELLSIEHPNHTHTQFAYDNCGRLIGQTRDQDAELVNYSYFTGGMTVANGGGRATAFGSATRGGSSIS